MRPGRPAEGPRAAVSGPFAGPRSLIARRGAHATAGSSHPKRSMSSGPRTTNCAEKRGIPWIRPVNMVVKSLPDFHNHACLRLVRRSDLDCFTATSVIWGASELQLRRAYLHRLQAEAATSASSHRKSLGRSRAGPAPCPHPWPTPCGAGQFLRSGPRRGPRSASASSAAAVRMICCGSIGPSRRSASATCASSTAPSRSRW